jgi:molybdenum cofactor cytidylyltransferase
VSARPDIFIRKFSGTVGILLAAGAGTRFGGRKLMERLPDGTPVGVASLRSLQAVFARVLAVVRKGDDELAHTLAAENAEVIESVDARLGMAHSLASAVQSSEPEIGWVVALGDMPCIQPATILHIADQLERSRRIIVPVFSGERGHPVGFPKDLRVELLMLTGDVGARNVLQKHPERILRLEVSDRGILQDIDTRADLRTLDSGFAQ